MRDNIGLVFRVLELHREPEALKLCNTSKRVWMEVTEQTSNRSL